MINVKRLGMAAAMAVMMGLSFNPLTANAKINIPRKIYSDYDKQPESVKKSFEDDGWDLELADGNELNYIYARGEYSENGYDISGVTVYEIKTVYLSDYPGYAKVALSHELGHFVDYSYYTYYGVLPSATEEFEYIYEKEAVRSHLYEDYGLSDTSEYFAQSYWAYIENKTDLKTYYPLTFKYIDNVLCDFDAAVGNGYTRKYDGGLYMLEGKVVPYSGR